MNCGSCGTELAHIEDWAEKNNLRLNCATTKEIVFRAKGKRGLTAPIPPPCEGIERVSSLTVLGVVIIHWPNDSCGPCQWLAALLSSCSRLLYALRVLRSHGISATSIRVTSSGSTVLAKLLYCAPAWSGFCSAADRVRLEAFLRRCQRLGYCSSTTPTLAEMFDEADESCSLASYRTETILQSHLPDRSSSQYNLRKKALTTKKNCLQRLRN